MKKALFIICILYTFKTIAQPTFNASDLNPAIGDVTTQIELDTVGINEGNAGANQVWNFNVILNPQFIDTINYISSSTVPSIGAFPLANIAAVQAGGPSSEYALYNAANNSLEFLGNISIDSSGNVDTTRYLTPLTQLIYPLTFQTAFTDSNSTGPIGSGPFTSNIKYGRAFLADAYGDITINNQLFSNVLRVNYKDTFTVDLGFFQAQIFIDVFQWYQQGNKESLLSIVKSSDGNNPPQKTVALSGSLSPALIKTIKENQVRVYPNPAINELKITNGFKGNTTFTIKDLNGKIMVSDQIDQLSRRIDISNLESGIYILEMKSKDKILTKKFVKRS